MTEISIDPDQTADAIKQMCRERESQCDEQEKAMLRDMVCKFAGEDWTRFPHVLGMDKRVVCGVIAFAVSVRLTEGQYLVRWEWLGIGGGALGEELGEDVYFDAPEEALEYVADVERRLSGVVGV